jgi:putative ABC transport system permease protein
VNVGRLAARNVTRNRLRTTLTVLGVSATVVTFVLLRTVLSAWTSASDYASKDRVATRHKITFIMPLPRRYVTEIRSLDGVESVAQANWFGARDPKHENDFFQNVAVEPKDFLEVYDEIRLPPEQRERWFSTKTGAIVGDVLAKRFGWKVGDRVTLEGTIYPGQWQFEISGIYTVSRRSLDRSSFYFHYDYLNDSPIAERMGARDQVGWIVTRVDDPAKTVAITRTIDEHFEERDVQTLSLSERAMNASFLGMASAILEAVDGVSIVILVIMVLILGNTVAMGVRERTHEYGVLRAIGFLPKHLAFFVMGEAVVISVLGGVVGVALSYPVVERGLGRFVEENMGGFFPYFRIAPATLVWAVVLAFGLGLIAAAIPARSAARLKVVDALRTTG